MRELPRDLVTILRTEAKNQRTPPIDYVIAEDGGRMVHTPEPDIAMAELLEEAATDLAAKDAELAAVKAELHQSRNFWSDELSAKNAQIAEARKALEIADAFFRCIRFDRDRDTFAAEAVDAIRAARRALESKGGER